MAKPKKIVRTAAQKLAYLDYAEVHNDSVACRDLGISSLKSLRDEGNTAPIGEVGRQEFAEKNSAQG